MYPFGNGGNLPTTRIGNRATNCKHLPKIIFQATDRAVITPAHTPNKHPEDTRGKIPGRDKAAPLARHAQDQKGELLGGIGWGVVEGGEGGVGVGMGRP